MISKQYKWLWTFWICTIVLAAPGETFSNTPVTKIISYNVENLFDNQHDTLKNDSAFLPEGAYHWSHFRYYKKLDHIAQVIVNISGWESAAIVGLCEVENDRCLRDLCYRLKRFNYKFIHQDSPDKRGIDVALLYDSTKVSILNSETLTVHLTNSSTRDILYTMCLVNNRDTIHTMMCHLPSQSGGATESDWKRKHAKTILQQHINNILHTQPNAKIIVMGDMNTTPSNDLYNMYNLMIHFEKHGVGTHKYHGVWSCLDQFYVSKTLCDKTSANIFSPEWLLKEDKQYLGNKPFRTYVGYRYQAGYSDHLPIVLTIDSNALSPK